VGIGQAQRHVVIAQQAKDVVVVPAGVAELEGIAMAARQHRKEGREPLAVLGELRRQLEQHRADLGRQRREPRLQEIDRVLAFLAEPFPMRDEFRRLPGEAEIAWRLGAPGAHRVERRRTVERAVDLGGRKLRGVPGEPILLRHGLWVEPAAPAVISPARRADQNAAHVLNTLALSKKLMLNNAMPSQWLSRPAGKPMSPKVPALADFRRIVVKVGSALMVDAGASRVKEDWLASLSDDIAGLHRDRRDVLVVSSGAIALGGAVLKWPKGPLRLEDSQAAAAVGQIALARTWTEALSRYGITAGQVLVTLQDTEERRRYLNARSTIERLLEWRSVPVINE